MNESELPRETLYPDEAPLPEAIEPPKPPFSASWREICAALAMYVLAWIWFDMEQPVWLLIFVAGFVGLTELLHWETPRPRESWFWLGCVLVLTASVVFGRFRAWEDVVFPLYFLHIFAVWWLLSRSGRLSEGESGHLLPYDALNGFIVFPFKHFFLRIRCLWHGLTHLGRGEKRVKAETIVWSGAAVLAAVLLFAKAVQLLSAADTGFGELLKDFRGLFPLTSTGCGCSSPCRSALMPSVCWPEPDGRTLRCCAGAAAVSRPGSRRCAGCRRRSSQC